MRRLGGRNRLGRHNAIGIGDAENDHTLLEACEYGYCLATYQPHLLTQDLRTRMEWQIGIAPGGRCALRGPDSDATAFAPTARRTFHEGHLRKYTEATLSAERAALTAAADPHLAHRSRLPRALPNWRNGT